MPDSRIRASTSSSSNAPNAKPSVFQSEPMQEPMHFSGKEALLKSRFQLDGSSPDPAVGIGVENAGVEPENAFRLGTVHQAAAAALCRNRRDRKVLANTMPIAL